jgi:hypothetical protein
MAPPVPATLPPFTSPGAPTVAGPGLRVVPGPGASSSHASYPSYPSYPSYQSQPESTSGHRSWILVGVVAAAAIVGSLTVWMLTRGGAGSARPDALFDLRADAPARVAAAAGDAPAPIAVEDAASDPPMLDGAPMIDAAPPDAEEVRIDAPMVDEITALFNGGRFAEALAACVRGFPVDHASTCALAACHSGDAARARAWLPKVMAGRRPRIVGQCKDLGVDLAAPKRPPPTPPPRGSGTRVDPCEADPASCQH